MGPTGIRNKLYLSLMQVFLILLSSGLLAQDPLSESSVSVNVNNKPLHIVLDNLTAQTGFYFTFDANLIDSQQRVDIEAEQESLRSVLNQLFPTTEFSFKIINRNIVIFPEKDVPPGEPVEAEFDVSKYKINGIVTDANGRNPLPYATIGVIDTRFGTVSNNDGKFKLVLPDSVINPILAVSFIGYRTAYHPVSEASGDPLIIRLEKQYVSIQEVIIRHEDPLKLLSESLKKVGENYTNVPSGAVAYYREKVQRNDKVLLFTEAVVEMARPAYSSAFRNDRLKLLRGRKIRSVAEEDTVLFRISSGINSMLSLDVVRNLPDFLDPGEREKYTYTFNDIVARNNKLVYVIGFEPRSHIDEPLFQGDIYLDQESLALIAAEFEYDQVRLGNNPELFVSRASPRIRVRPVKASYRVEYTEHDHSYHLGQVQGSVIFKVRKKRQWIASRYSISLEMAVTHVSPGNPPDIPFREQLWPDVILSDQEFRYDPDFWGAYNTIVAERSLQEGLDNIDESIQEIITE